MIKERQRRKLELCFQEVLVMHGRQFIILCVKNVPRPASPFTLFRTLVGTDKPLIVTKCLQAKLDVQPHWSPIMFITRCDTHSRERSLPGVFSRLILWRWKSVWQCSDFLCLKLFNNSARNDRLQQKSINDAYLKCTANTRSILISNLCV